MSSHRTALEMLSIFIVATLVPGCSDTPTALFINIDSDLEVPNELDRLDLLLTASRDAEGGLCAPAQMELELDRGGLPLVIGIEPGATHNEWMALRVVGRLDGEEVVRTERVATLPDEGEWQIEIFLDGRCFEFTCAENEHCVEGVCEVVPLPGIFEEAATSDSAVSCGDFGQDGD
jgi:hypothetical protein